jgi:hypothetical protein
MRLKMLRRFNIAVALACAFCFSTAAQTINVTTATIVSGNVHVEGGQAPRRAQVSWEGVVVGATNGGGSFAFDSTKLPQDCVGLLTIGAVSRDVVISGCTIAAGGGVPRTGQTATFAVGDDGYFQRGTALPMPRFTDHGNGTVTDHLTNLVWLKNANCTMFTAAPTWDQAFAMISELNSSGAMNGIPCGDTSNGGANQTDWRLPNIREYLSLVNYAYSNLSMSNAAGTGQATNGDPFLNMPNFSASNSGFWTSTSDADFPSGAALAVGYFFGHVVEASKTEQRPIMAVRGGS